ncbi:MAG: hypothetical protein CBCREVIR_0612 [Candidatus Burkholderia crenata]|nr:MAG: hypothetical protein CBCREVIR_0612 [Candidatus Burkholderia crenata]
MSGLRTRRITRSGLCFRPRSGTFSATATLFKQLFRPEDAFLATRIAFSHEPTLRARPLRFVVTLKSSIAPIQSLLVFSSSGF